MPTSGATTTAKILQKQLAPILEILKVQGKQLDALLSHVSNVQLAEKQPPRVQDCEPDPLASSSHATQSHTSSAATPASASIRTLPNPIPPLAMTEPGPKCPTSLGQEQVLPLRSSLPPELAFSDPKQPQIGTISTTALHFYPLQRENPWYAVPDPVWNTIRSLRALTPPNELTPASALPSNDINTTQARVATSKPARSGSPSSENDAGLSSQLSEKALRKKRKRDDDPSTFKGLPVAGSSSSGKACRLSPSDKRRKIFPKGVTTRPL